MNMSYDTEGKETRSAMVYFKELFQKSPAEAGENDSLQSKMFHSGRNSNQELPEYGTNSIHYSATSHFMLFFMFIFIYPIQQLHSDLIHFKTHQIH
jgi:hypothetical protein